MLSTDELLAVLWRRRVSLAVTFVLVVATVAAVTFSLPNVYQTTAYIWVTSESDAGSDFEATQTNQVLMTTFAELLQTQGVATEVAAALPSPLDPSAVQERIRIEPVTQSQLIAVIAEGPNPDQAKALADAYANVFLDRAAELQRRSGSDSRLSLAEPAPVPASPVRPRPRLYLLIGTAVAAVLAVVTALVRHRLDQRLDISDSTTEILELPIIGRIPQRSTPLLSLFTHSEDREATDPRMEAFGLLLANLAFTNHGELPRSVAMVSANEAEGKSTCCAGIGHAAAERGVNTVLVDGDLRRPQLSSMLLPAPDRVDLATSGFSNLLLRKTPLAVNEVVRPAAESNLHIIPSGPLPPSPAALLAQKTLGDFERRLHNLFDLVVYDTPPLSFAADASLVSAAAEGTILVVDARKTGRNAVLQAVEQLRRANAKVLGIVVNRWPESSDVSYYSSRHYGRPQTRALRRGSSNGSSPSDAAARPNSAPPQSTARRRT